ncbi:hypothetical protein HNY73_018980 [Argiope bruennichi]|uniref:Integrase catalytic domain-containing protein n=1 Tax=Argiope bruennichi TaxID=94029 RepID=A0A8T0EG08_ARGBR|nr:hypothetical protein HNY73_018980 [Argiope bruennichi]
MRGEYDERVEWIENWTSGGNSRRTRSPEKATGVARGYPIADQEATNSLTKYYCSGPDFSRYGGRPFHIHSDQGRNFTSAVARHFVLRLKIDKTQTKLPPLTSPVRDGMVERFNRTILNISTIPTFHESTRLIGSFLCSPCSCLPIEVPSMKPLDWIHSPPDALRSSLRLPCDLLFGRPSYGAFLLLLLTKYVHALQERLESVHDSPVIGDHRTEKIKTMYDTIARQDMNFTKVTKFLVLELRFDEEGLSPKVRLTGSHK